MCIQFIKGAKQVQISVAHGHRVHVERFARIAASLISNPQNVSQLRDRIGLFSPFLIGGNSLEVFQRQLRIVVEQIQNIVMPQKRYRPTRWLRS